MRPLAFRGSHGLMGGWRVQRPHRPEFRTLIQPPSRFTLQRRLASKAVSRHHEDTHSSGAVASAAHPAPPLTHTCPAPRGPPVVMAASKASSSFKDYDAGAEGGLESKAKKTWEPDAPATVD